MSKLFPTYEIGSIAKPSWRVKGYANKKLNQEDFNEAKKWAEILGINYAEVERVLKGDSPNRKQKIVDLSSLYVLKMFEKAGLDYVYDGEQRRVEMYEHVIRNLGGFKFSGWIKSFDYRYFKKASVVEKVSYDKSYYLEEYEAVKKQTDLPLKIPITGPYTLTDWTFNEYYEKKNSNIKSFPKRRREARRELILDIVDEALRPEFNKLVDAGVEWIQIDEPAVTTKETAEEMEMFVEAYNRLTEGFDIEFSLHNCFSNYGLLAQYVPSLKKCSQLSLEFANRDVRETGPEHPGYDGLYAFLDNGYKGAYAPGVLDVHTDFIESPELVRSRVLYVADLVGKEKVWVTPDCGLRTRSWDVAYQKLVNLIKGKKLAEELA
jgi:5-methyltetrahydropteroyltriglutamate--homocysteine methyltransferase